MSEEKTTIIEVEDMGACAYLMMHGYEVHLIGEKTFSFLIPEKETDDFDFKQVQYLKSDFHRFDACIMSLKKMRSMKMRSNKRAY